MDMKKTISLLVSLSIIISLLPSSAFAADTVYLVKENYEAQAAGSAPANGASVSGSVIVREADSKGNKAAELSGNKNENSLHYKFESKSNTVSMFAGIEYTDTWSATSFYVSNSSGKTLELAYVTEAGTLYTGDGHILTGVPRNRRAALQFTYNQRLKKLSVYLNGRAFMTNRFMGANAFDSIAGFGIKVSGRDDALCTVDDFSVFEGSEVLKTRYTATAGKGIVSGPVSGGGASLPSDDTEAPEEFISDTVYVNRSFDEEGVPAFDKLTVTPGANSVEIGKSVFDNNKYIVLKKKEASESHIGFSGTTTERYHVIEASFSTEDNTPSGRLLYVRDGNAESMFNTFLSVKTNGNVETTDGTVIARIEPLKWTDIALILDIKSLTFDIYVDKELKLDAVPFQNKTITGLPLMRIGCDNSASTGTLLIDNIKSYEGNKLREIEEQKYGPITEQNNIPMNYLGVKKAVQPYANTIFTNKTKSDSVHDIIAENEDTIIYAHVDDIKTLFGNDAVMTAAHSEREGYYNLLETAAANGYKQQNMDTRLYVFDTTEPKLNEKQLTSIQRYMYYVRPTADELKTLHAQTNSGHPRILMNQSKLAEIKSRYQTDALMREWGDNVIAEAASWFGRDFANYQEILDNVDPAITSLAMAYHLTGDNSYAVRAWNFIKILCDMENWDPDHYLTTGEFTYIVALGYDWLYDTFTQEQRQYIEENLLEKGVGYTHKLYFNQLVEGVDGYIGWWQAESNWNAVCNGGTICGAIALMDVYPDICAELIENAQKGLEGMLTLYYPHGTYEEGLSYWNYAFTFLTHALTSMRNTFGTDFGFFDVPGLSETGWYVIKLTGSTMVMTMGDVDSSLLNNPHIMLAADEYNDRLLMAARLNEMEKLGYKGGAFEMIYYNPELLGEEINMPLDTFMDGAEIISLREKWYDRGAAYLGASGGNNARAHGHMDIGSYVVDMAGERFITDIGAEDYSAPGGYFTTNRYYFYRARPEGHNLYVINPENTLEYYGMDKNAGATGEIVVSKPRGAIGVMDLSQAYAGYATSAVRGYMLTDDRRSVVVRDEIDLTNPDSTVHWHIQTKAEVEFVGDNQAILSQNGKKLLMTVETNSPEWTFSEGTPQTMADITKTVVTERDNVKAGIRQLKLIAKGSGRLNITVKYKLLDDDYISPNPPATDISQWTIPDGEPVELPTLDSIYVDGEPLDKFEPTVTGYKKLVATRRQDIPVVSVSSAHRVEITQAADFGQDAIIKVFVDGNDSIYRTYRTNIYKLPPLDDIDGMRRYPVANVTASEIPQEENGPANVIDGSLDTRWAAEGTEGQWICLELDDVYSIEKIGTSWMSGSARAYRHKIEISLDGTTWTTVFDGASSGTTNDLEYAAAGGQNAKYIRCTG